jgi:hypothetical protein
VSASHPAEQVGVLTIRAWVEPGGAGWRARIIRSQDVHGGGSTMDVFHSVDDVCESVRSWLEEYLRDAER